MSQHRRRTALFAAMLSLAACDAAGPSPTEEVAEELRALRLLLANQKQIAPAGTGASGTGAMDRQAIESTLAPLRDVLQGLATSQRDVENRQLQLTQELQRWSQLLVESVAAARSDEAKALVLRMQQMEQALSAQDQRHREVETLLQGALDKTADHLEDFLKRVNGLSPATPPAGNGPPRDEAAGGGDPERSAPAPTVPQQPGGDSGTAAQRVGAHRSARNPFRWAWAVTAILAIGIGALFVRRWRRDAMRTAAAEVPQMDAEGPSSAYPAVAAGAEVPSATSEVPREPGVQEIWAAAALLGEAVGRLRQTKAAPSEATPKAAAPGLENPAPGADKEWDLDSCPLEDLFVLDDDLSLAPSRSSSRLPPETVICRLATADPVGARSEVVRRLGADPRVLRQPGPVIANADNGLAVTFAVLPGLAAGERSRIEQDLRDAVG